MNKYIISQVTYDKYMKILWICFFLAHTVFRDIIGGIQKSSIIILMMSTFIFLFIKLSKQDYIINPHKLPWFTCVYGLFVVYTILSKKYGLIVNPDEDVTYYLGQIVLPSVLCMDIYFDTRSKVDDLLNIFIVATVIYAFVATISTPISLWANAKYYGGITHIQRNLASMIYVIAFCMCLYFISEKKKKVFYFACAMVLFMANLITGARKGVIQVVLSFVLFVLLQGRLKDKVKYIKVIIIAVIFFVIAYINIPWVRETFGERMLAVFDSSIEDSSMENRDLFRGLAFLTFLEHPIWGIGCDGFCKVNESITGLALYCHSNIVEILCDYGIVGFILYYINYFIGLLSAFYNRKDNLGKFVLYTIIPLVIIEYGQIDYFIAAGVFAVLVPLLAAKNINK